MATTEGGRTCTRCSHLGREQGPAPLLQTTGEFIKRYLERKILCLQCLKDTYEDFEGADKSTLSSDIIEAPVKAAFLRAAQKREYISSVSAAEGGAVQVDDEKKRSASVAAVAVLSKKSKRAQKRDRAEAQKSVAELCAGVCRGHCPFGDGCKFNHDVEAFLAQKPADLPGVCPFLGTGKACPYGLGCRYAGTHSEDAAAAAEKVDAARVANGAVAEGAKEGGGVEGLLLGDGQVKTAALPHEHSVVDETNRMDKGLQINLRKGNFDFPLADAQLAKMGITAGTKGSGYKAVQAKGGRQKAKAGTCYAFLKGECTYGDKCRFDHPKKDGEAGGEGVVNPAAEGGEGGEPKEGAAAGGGGEGAGGKDYVEVKAHPRERKIIDFRGKTYLAPLTTVGNLPFRRVCKALGCDITIGEMALCTNLLQGQASEWALLRRHPSEDLFGVQICGGYPDSVARTCDVIENELEVDFVDINCGCPIDLICNKGAGSSLLLKQNRLQKVVTAASAVLSCPLTFKIRTGYGDKIEDRCAHNIIPNAKKWGAAAVTLHGRSRQQRYTRLADWEYVSECGQLAENSGVPLIGNGDVYSWTDHKAHLESTGLHTTLIARGALMKPWLFTEIKEERHWDISAGERLEYLKKFCSFGLEHWGSDSKGVETTRRFLLEWMSFLYRYVPVGLLEVLPQYMHWRPPPCYGRNDLETMMLSDNAVDWVKISTMLLGPPPANFAFAPKHKSNAYADGKATQVEG